MLCKTQSFLYGWEICMHVHTHIFSDTILYNCPQRGHWGSERKEMSGESWSRSPGSLVWQPAFPSGLLSRVWSSSRRKNVWETQCCYSWKQEKVYFQFFLLLCPSFSSGWHLSPGIAQLSRGASGVRNWLSQIKWKLKRTSGLQAQLH